MANFCRVLPNHVWEELEQRGLLNNAFPSQIPTKKQALLSKFPQSIQHSVEKLLANLTNDIDWNDNFELVYKSVTIPQSNIVDLLTNFLLKSKKFEFLKGSEFFPKLEDIRFGEPEISVETLNSDNEPSEIKSALKWINFENIGKNGAVHKKKISQKKNWVCGGKRVYKKQQVQRSKKSVKSTK